MKSITIKRIVQILTLTSVLALIALPVRAAEEPAPAQPEAAKAKDDASKKPLWDSSLTAGLTLSKGNSDTVLGTLLFDSTRKQDRNEFNGGVEATYGENQGVKNNELYRGHFQYTHDITDRFYAIARIEAMRDEIANIQYRVILSPGVGYYFIKKDLGFLRGEVGPSFITERRGNQDKNYASIRIAERGEFKVSKTAKAWEYVEFLPQVDRPSNYIINSEVGIDVAINTKFSVRSFLQDTYNSEPAKGSKPNDLKLVSGIAYKF